MRTREQCENVAPDDPPIGVPADQLDALEISKPFRLIVGTPKAAGEISKHPEDRSLIECWTDPFSKILQAHEIQCRMFELGHIRHKHLGLGDAVSIDIVSSRCTSQIMISFTLEERVPLACDLLSV